MQFHTKLVEAILREPTIQGAILIGSRSRPITSPIQCDEFSDLDFHIICQRPILVARCEWLPNEILSINPIRTRRLGRLGTATKVTSVAGGLAFDLVLIPAFRLRILKILFKFKAIDTFRLPKNAIHDIAVVIRSGFRFIKGADEWKEFYQDVCSSDIGRRQSVYEIAALADGFYCDFVSTISKIDRGELAAAQRWINVYLMEAVRSLIYLSESKQYGGFAVDSRRCELQRKSAITLETPANAVLEKQSLLASANACRDVFLHLIYDLIGDRWRWPTQGMRPWGGLGFGRLGHSSFRCASPYSPFMHIF